MRQRTGSIDITADGRHRVRVTVPGLGRKTEGIYETEEDAERARVAAVEVLADEGPDDGATVHQLTEAWLTSRELRRAVSDPDSDWSRWRQHIAGDPIAKLPAKSLRRSHVRAWVERVEAKGRARTSVTNTLGILRGTLARAVEDGLLKANPAADVKVARQKRTQEPWTYANPAEQFGLVLAAPAAERAIVGVAIGLGLRAGELVALRLADVHVDGDRPHVVIRYGGAPDLPTKTGKIRQVPLFGIALEAMRAWLAALPTYAAENPHRLAFPRKRGGFRDENHVIPWEAWKQTLDVAGITRRFRWHDLRHTCASSLVSGWWGRAWSLIEVRDMLGHSSVTTTERYAHLAGTALDRAAAETRGELALNRPSALQRRDLVGYSAEFLNRRPPVQVGSGAPSDSAALAAVVAAAEGHFRPIAVDLLVAVHEGRAADAERLGVALATALVDAPAVVAARRVLAGGPHAVSAAVDLAGQVAGILDALSARAGVGS